MNQAGDTIVEVLIVVVVIGTVIAGGYKVAVASLQSTQLSQERGYALKLAEGQLEYLKAANDNDPSFLSGLGAAGFCLADDTTANAIVSHGIIGGSPTDTIAADDYANYTTNGCKRDPNNNNCAGYCYYYGIKSQGNNNYTATVRWDGPHNKQQVQLSYRIYQ